MRTIHKYPIKLQDEFTVRLPRGAEFLHLATQDGIPQMWWLVDTDEKPEERLFAVLGTGNPADHVSAVDYLGTFGMKPFVWHVFRIP